VKTLLHHLRTVLRWTDLVTVVLAATLTCALVLLTIVVVIYRYVLDSPLTWAGEVQESMFIWLTFLGAAVAMARREHSGFEGVLDALPRPARVVVASLSSLVVICFLGYCSWIGFGVLPQLAAQTTPTLGISVAFNYAAFPIGMLLLVLQFLGNLSVDPVHPASQPEDGPGVPV
jgi:TRAP-type C4-dicarboxylate transport system permease small subunit